MLRLILGGAALQRCGGHPDVNAALAAEVRISSRRLVLPRSSKVSLAILLLALLFSTYTFADSGAVTYKDHCSACHGSNGAGDTMLGKNLKLRSLASDEVQTKSDDDLARIISKGKGRMPAYDRKLSKDQIGDVAKYIRSLKK
jgi:cytochrome c6